MTAPKLLAGQFEIGGIYANDAADRQSVSVLGYLSASRGFHSMRSYALHEKSLGITGLVRAGLHGGKPLRGVLSGDICCRSLCSGN